jgi:hypothetical protein
MAALTAFQKTVLQVRLGLMYCGGRIFWAILQRNLLILDIVAVGLVILVRTRDQTTPHQIIRQHPVEVIPHQKEPVCLQ